MSSAATTGGTAVPTPSAGTPRRAALAGWIGSALEHYDFAVYGTAAAVGGPAGGNRLGAAVRGAGR